MLVKKNKKVINDGKVVMVSLTVVDKSNDQYHEATGRATCDLTSDVFNLQTGIAIAEKRAYQKIIKQALSYHKYQVVYASKVLEKEKDIVANLTNKLSKSEK